MSEPTIDHALRRRVVTGVLFLSYIASTNQLIVAPAMPVIGAQLGDVAQMPWIITAYLLASTIVTPLYGRLGDMHGRRPMIYVCLALFLVGSVLCALAPTMLTLIVARAVQGLGGGGLVPLAQSAIADVVPPRERGRYQAYFSTLYMFSSFTGPIFGGVVAEYLHWSWIFWINLPLCIVAVVGSDRALRVLPRRHVDHSLDVVGTALISAMSIALMLVLSWGGVSYAWTSPAILGLATATFALGAAYYVHSLTVSEPLVPLAVLRNRVVLQVAAGAFFTAVAAIGLLSYAPLYFQLVLNVPTSASGVAVTALVIGASIGSVLQAQIVARETLSRWVVNAALAVSTAAICALAWLGSDANIVVGAILLAVTQFGIGCTFPVTNITMQNAVEQRHVGIATATTYFIRSFGGAAASAFFGAILLAGGHADIIATLKQHAQTVTSVDPSLARGFATVLFVVGAVHLISLLAFATTERRPLRETVS